MYCYVSTACITLPRQLALKSTATLFLERPLQQSFGIDANAFLGFSAPLFNLWTLLSILRD